jgi:hypothetical protein
MKQSIRFDCPEAPQVAAAQRRLSVWISPMNSIGIR